MSRDMTTDNMSNEEVIETLKGIVFNGFDRTTRKERQALDLAIKVLEGIDNAPTVEQSQGKWIIDGHHIRCNRCNEYICNTDREGNKIPDNFCPNCGADMRGDKQ